jgi:hypothetical protein
MLKAKVRKTKYGYKGYIVCMNGKKQLWSESFGANRLCREHAEEDAHFLKDDRENTWVNND